MDHDKGPMPEVSSDGLDTAVQSTAPITVPVTIPPTSRSIAQVFAPPSQVPWLYESQIYPTEYTKEPLCNREELQLSRGIRRLRPYEDIGNRELRRYSQTGIDLEELQMGYQRYVHAILEKHAVKGTPLSFYDVERYWEILVLYYYPEPGNRQHFLIDQVCDIGSLSK